MLFKEAVLDLIIGARPQRLNMKLITSTVPTSMLMMTIHLKEPAAVRQPVAVRSGDAEAEISMNL